MHNYRLTVEYSGLNFNGWQKQKYTDNTVQEKIENAIKIILKSDIKLTGSGRTDAGVSAYNQTANFFHEENIDKNKFLRSVNSVLPGEITVKEIKEVSLKFHSRYSAKRRDYIYKITTAKKSISGEYFYKINFEPDFEKIDRFMDFIRNLENFKSLCKNKEDKHNFHCKIYNFKYKIQKSENDIIFTISASRFLHSMVRAIIGCTLEIGRGKKDLKETIKKIREGEKLRIHYLPANALFLKKIHY